MSELLPPPYSTEAEQAVLGGVMLSHESFDDVADIVRADDFYRADHRVIWEAIAALDTKGQPFDAFSVAVWLRESGKEEETGGISYIGKLSGNCPSVANIRHYATVVADRARERRALSAIVKAEAEIRGTGSTDEKLDRAQALISDAAEKRSKTGPMSAAEMLPAWVDSLEERFTRGGEIIGVKTGFADLDKITAGLQPSDLIIVAGRPSMGKTTFALNIAENVAVWEGVPTLVFSMEMPTEQLLNKNNASLGEVPLDLIRRGDLDSEMFNKITGVTGRLKSAPLYYDDTPALTPIEMRARARRVKRKHGLGLVVIDYLQLMRSGIKSSNRVDEVSEISRALKAMAKELRVPVVALSQLSRKCEERADKRPMMSDLRESGAIEQDADVIAFVYRDEVYDPESEAKGSAEIIIRKQRNGQTGTVRLVSQLEFSRFKNFARNGD